MKFLALLLLSFSLNSYADTTIQRAFGSVNANCQIKGDMGKRFYKLDLESEKLTDDKRELSLRVTFLKCAEVEGKLEVVESSASEVLHSLVLLPNGEIGQTSNTLLMANFVASDKFENVLGKAKLDLAAETLVFNFSLAKNMDHAFVRAGLKSRVEFPNGEVLNDVFEYNNGYSLSFK